MEKMGLEFILTETAAERWLKDYVGKQSAEEVLAFSEGTVGDFDRGLKALFGIEAVWHIDQQHIALYYVKYLDHLTSGVMSRRTIPEDLIANGSAAELSAPEYMHLHLAILKRFLVFCWAQEYLGKDFMKWRWAGDDLKKLSDSDRGFY